MMSFDDNGAINDNDAVRNDAAGCGHASNKTDEETQMKSDEYVG